MRTDSYYKQIYNNRLITQRVQVEHAIFRENKHIQKPIEIQL